MKKKISQVRDKSELKEDLKFLVIHGSTMLGSYFLKQAAEKIVVEGFKKKVPVNPWEDEDISWSEAIAWAAFIGATAGVIKLFIKRGAKIGIEKVI